MKIILITGATGDIGRELCVHYAKKHAKQKEEYHLIITARSEDSLKKLAGSLNETYGINVIYFVTDFSKQASFEELVGYINALKRLDGLVIMPPRPSPSKELIPDDEEIDLMLKSSLRGPMKLIKDLIPALKAGRALEKNYFSQVVLVSGLSSVQPLSNAFMYNTLRTAWLGPMKTLADSLGEYGVIFNTASFGQVLTEKFLERVDQEAHNTNATPEEVLAKKSCKCTFKKIRVSRECRARYYLLSKS